MNVGRWGSRGGRRNGFLISGRRRVVGGGDGKRTCKVGAEVDESDKGAGTG